MSIVCEFIICSLCVDGIELNFLIFWCVGENFLILFLYGFGLIKEDYVDI